MYTLKFCWLIRFKIPSYIISLSFIHPFIFFTVFQSLPVNGVVIVTSPQELVQMIVKKAFNMAQMMDIPVSILTDRHFRR